jgi:cell division protein FtsB
MTAYIKSKSFSKKNHNRGLTLLSILIVFSIFCLGFLYLVQTNSLVSKSYQIRQEKERLKELQNQSQNLEMEIAKWHSPANLEKLVEPLGLVEAKGVVYLKTEKVMAVKNDSLMEVDSE